MTKKAPVVLVVDDDRGSLEFLKLVLSKAGYEVLPAMSGAQVLEMAQETPPDLFVLDIMMPEMDGLELCRRLKADAWLKRAPVIFLTAMERPDDILRGFEAGAADYIIKPVKRAELLARVQTHVQLYRSILELERLNKLALDASPSTGLPGNNSLNEAITRSLESGEDLCVIYCDIDYFKPFNDKYGFARGDGAIKFTASAVVKGVETVCGPGCFIGHIGGDDFCAITPSDKAQAVGEEIARLFDAGISRFYDADDAARGSIVSVNRRGETEVFPIMTLSMAGVHLRQRPFRHYLEVSNVCAEIKKYAKESPGSGIMFDRRKGDL